MEALSKRVQVLFSKEKHLLLESLARRRGASVGALIRKAVEEQYLKGQRGNRMSILDRISKMNLPVSDWKKMEKEILLGAAKIRKK